MPNKSNLVTFEKLIICYICLPDFITIKSNIVIFRNIYISRGVVKVIKPDGIKSAEILLIKFLIGSLLNLKLKIYKKKYEKLYKFYNTDVFLIFNCVSAGK